MSLHPEVELVCDGAPTQFSCDWMPPIHAKTGARARVFAAKNGWLTAQPGGKDYCPDHRPAAALPEERTE